MKNNSNHLRIILRLCSLFFLVLIIATPALAEDEIFEEYFSNVRPEPQDKPTPVKIGIIVLDVDSIDGATQSFVANFGIVAQWEDPRLAKKNPYCA